MLEQYKRMASLCTRCGQCIVGEAGYICPAQQGGDGFDPNVARGRNIIVKALTEGKLQYSRELMESSYTCMGCRSCYEQCQKIDPKTRKKGIDVSEMMQAMRVDMTNMGLEPEALASIDEAAKKTHNPFGEDVSIRTKWADGLDLPESGEVFYFAGCYAAYRYPKIAKATAAILRKAGVDIAYLGEDEWCCGVPEFWDGQREMAQEMAIHNIEALKKAGCRKLITTCAGCYHTLKSEYPKIYGELPFEVVHSSEVIADLIREGKVELTEEVKTTVTYHDPCHLGRHENVYEQPREALKAIKGATVVEMPRNRADAWCCGGGSVVAVANPELSKNVADNRINEAKGTAADLIVSCCPLCEDGLKSGARRNRMKVADLSEIVADAMGLKY